MGRAKAMLPVGEEVMLQRVVRIVSSAVGPVIVVAAPDQDLPELPSGVLVARDEREYLGPLAGIGVGLRALPEEIDAAYCTSCDVPLLKREFIQAIVSRLGAHDAAVVREDGFFHPLAAVYRRSLVPAIADLVAEDRLRPLFLIQSVNTRAVDAEELRAVDPDLASLRNINTLEDYSAVLETIERVEH